MRGWDGDGWMDGTLVLNNSKKQETKLFVSAEIVKNNEERRIMDKATREQEQRQVYNSTTDAGVASEITMILSLKTIHSAIDSRHRPPPPPLFRTSAKPPPTILSHSPMTISALGRILSPFGSV